MVRKIVEIWKFGWGMYKAVHIQIRLLFFIFLESSKLFKTIMNIIKWPDSALFAAFWYSISHGETKRSNKVHSVLVFISPHRLNKSKYEKPTIKNTNQLLNRLGTVLKSINNCPPKEPCKRLFRSFLGFRT